MISTDLNYRAKLWKYGGDSEAIMTELTSYCDIILGNEEDAEKYFGIKPEGLDITKEGFKVLELNEGISLEYLQTVTDGKVY